MKPEFKNPKQGFQITFIEGGNIKVKGEIKVSYTKDGVDYASLYEDLLRSIESLIQIIRLNTGRIKK
jgi:hypothetical protein